MANIALGHLKSNRKCLNTLVVSVIYFCPEKSAENRKKCISLFPFFSVTFHYNGGNAFIEFGIKIKSVFMYVGFGTIKTCSELCSRIQKRQGYLIWVALPLKKKHGCVLLELQTKCKFKMICL